MCYLDDHEEFLEFKPDWNRINDSHPRMFFLVPAYEIHPETTPQLELQFYQSSVPQAPGMEEGVT